MRVLALRSFACALAVALVVALFAPSAVAAQAAPAAPVACRDSTCRLLFDWGGGQTASSFPTDRRYGSGDDFESQVRSVLAARGFRMSDVTNSGEIVITLRPRMKKAMCDVMSGTNTDMSCQTISDLALVFSGGVATLKPPGGRSLRNSCGDVTVMMSMAQFGRYAGEMLAFYVEGEKKGERRPSTKC
jgi:hypothetical protein